MLELLSPREKEALSLIAQGLSRKEILSKMDISGSTLKCYISRIYEKFDLVNLGGATAIVRAVLIYQKELMAKETSYSPKWERLFDLMDKEEFTVADFLAVICTSLLKNPSREHYGRISLQDTKFEILIREHKEKCNAR